MRGLVRGVGDAHFLRGFHASISSALIEGSAGGGQGSYLGN